MSLATNMASAEELERWKAIGGSVEEAVGPKKGNKKGSEKSSLFVTPSGDKLKSWKEALAVLVEREGKKPSKPDADADAKKSEAKDKDSGKEAKAKAPSAKKAKKAAETPKAEEPAPADVEMADAEEAPAAAAEPATGGKGAKRARPASTKKAAAGKKGEAAKEEAAEEVKVKEEPAAAAEAEAEEAAAAPAAPKSAGKKKAAGASSAKKAASAKKVKKEEAKEEDEDEDEEMADAEEAEVKEEDEEEAMDPSKRKAAQAKKSYKEGSAGLRASKNDYVEVKEEPRVDNEATALKETGTATSVRRRLTDFSLVDEAGAAVTLERALLLPGHVSLTGVVHPEAGAVPSSGKGASADALVKEKGRRVEGSFGPLKEWRAEYSKAGAKLLLRTAAALYEVVRPSASYRKLHADAEELLDLCHQVYLALSPAAGGSLTASLEEVVAKLARTKVVKTYGSARDALLLNAKAVLGQLSAMPAPEVKGNKGNSTLRDTAFGEALAAEVAKGPYVTRTMTNGIVIGGEDSGAQARPANQDARAAALEEADELMARKLQAKEDAAQAMGAGRGAGGRGGAPKGETYIRISEEEIADDYPLPKQYEKEVEETDELLLADPEDLVGLDPDALPRRLLHDFAFYNAEGFMSTLELVPMFNGAQDHNVEVYGSGVIADEGDDFAAGGIPTTASAQAPATEAGAAAGEGGSNGAGGSSGGAAPEAAAQEAQPQGMRLYLSQIRDWFVECSCDMIFICVRTDVATYRLVKPQEKYAPWFRTVVKAAQLAVRVIGMLADESRASKLSFNDIVKRLATETQEGAPTWVSKRPELVERFLVVHGQIVLNQFKAYPNKAIQRAAFVGELRARMEQRKHCKLYMGKPRKAVAVKAARSGNANPMRNRAASGLRAKPMPATATTMVKAVWRNYFYGGAAARAAAEAAAAEAAIAKEVEEDANEEDADDKATEDALAGPAKGRGKAAKAAAGEGKAKAKKKAKAAAAPAFVGASLRKDTKGRTLYKSAKVGDVSFSLGDVVTLAPDEDEEAEAANNGAGVGAGAAPAEPPLGLVTAIYEDADGDKMVQVRVLLRGHETVLGDAGSDGELYVTEDTEERALVEVTAKCTAKRLTREWEWSRRLEYHRDDEELRKRNDKHREAGEPLEYVYRHLYLPHKGMFCKVPEELLDCSQGAFVEPPTEPIALGLLPEGKGFIKDGVEYRIGDVMYLHPQTFGIDVKKAGAKKGAAKKAPAKKKGRKGEDSEEEAESSGAEESEEEEVKSESSGEEEEPAAKRKKGDKGKKEEAKGGKGKAAAAAKASSSKAAEKGGKKGAKGGKKAEKEEEPEEAVEEEGAEGEPKLPEYLKNSKRHKGSNEGLKAFGLAQLVEVAGTASRAGAKVPTQLVVRRLYRPEDVSADCAYRAGWWDVYAGPLPSAGSKLYVDVDEVVGKAAAALKGTKGTKFGDVNTELDTFKVVGSYDPAHPKATGPLPSSLDVTSKEEAKGSGKGSKKGEASKDSAAAAEEVEKEEESEVAMRSLDIFAGCGGLSEGMHQAGVAETKWAIEYDQAAADAFALNNPDAKVFCNNCNVLLRAAMAKAGLLEDCDACEDCMTQAAALTPEYLEGLPLPGEVEFIMGGPPCQGYSGMNRFNKGNWSMVQNSMVMAYLSYCDFYRPRYFLLENVRNFVSHNKSFTFRLTLRTLLDMGYQVRFGVLNAGNYGVPQSRKRTIIWAAAPNETLPDWPKARHAFYSPQLTINLPGGVAYTAVPQAPGGGAPLRAVTVKDAIADLPAIENGHSQEEAAYTEAAVSAFQHFIRGGNEVLRDHICKEMNELNLERCRCIPKNLPGADWRELQLIVAKDPSREFFKGQSLVPWCLPNTADRHNGWRGLFGRLDLNGHFPTSTTDPQPMGKVGQVFHPTQDRIVSVRECARSQGFPDRFRFYGNVHNKHRQVGNAVPPPLAAALGRQLRRVLEAKKASDLEAMLAEQM